MAQFAKIDAGRRGLLALAPGLQWWADSQLQVAMAFMEFALLAALLNRCSRCTLLSLNVQSSGCPCSLAALNFCMLVRQLCCHLCNTVAA